MMKVFCKNFLPINFRFIRSLLIIALLFDQ